MLELGLVGKPNTGKSTFFNATTLADAPIGGYPFTTIDANVGVTYIRSECPCREFNFECNPRNSRCIGGIRYVPVRMIDVAGLVQGAYEGRGLGNQFLDNLREASVLIHVIDAAGVTDSEGKTCPPGDHDPVKDIDFLENEIDQWITSILEKGWSRFARKARLEEKNLAKAITNRMSGLGVNRSHIITAMRSTQVPDNPEDWSKGDLSKFASEIRKVSKPIMIAANKMDIPTAEENIERLNRTDRLVIPTSAIAELDLRRATEKNMINYIPGEGDFDILEREKLSEKQIRGLESIRELLNKWGSTGIQKVVDEAIYNLLKMIVVYPVDDENKFTDKKGNILPDAILMPEGITSREFAYEIHSDLGDTFIHAIDARTKRRIGEDKKLKNGSIIKIVAGKGR